jgi:hypothetical protein
MLADLNDWLIEVKLERYSRRAPPRLVRKVKHDALITRPPRLRA